MNIGIYGGTFNPPHLGHLLLAQSAIDALALDRVLMVPAFRSPFKLMSESLPAETRAEMVALAVSGNDRLACEYYEVRRGGVSFTVDTVRHLRTVHPQDHFFLLMGADTFNEFPLWKEPEAIAGLATIAVAQRPGVELDPASVTSAPATSAPATGSSAISAPAFRRFDMPLVDISSTDIRRRVREGRSIQYLVPWTVQVFIESHGLYRESD